MAIVFIIGREGGINEFIHLIPSERTNYTYLWQ